MSSIVGRIDELKFLDAFAALPTHADSLKTLTIVGPGGVGKNTLLRSWSRSSNTKMAWIDVNLLAQDASILLRLAEVLGASNSRVPSILDALQRKEICWVVLDNCEMSAEAAARAMEELSRALFSASTASSRRKLALVALSRIPLSYVGETICELEPLPVGAPLPAALSPAAMSPAALSPAAELLLQRLHDRDLMVDALRDKALLEKIVFSLQGLPLAIELAAARADTMSLADLLLEISQTTANLELQHAEVGRHRSLAACFELSLRSCSALEIDALERLSYCAPEGFDHACASEMLGDDAQSVLRSLHRKALLFERMDSPSSRRYGMYVGIRELVGPRAEARGIRRECASRHLRYFARRIALPLNGVRSISTSKHLRALVDAWRGNLEIARRSVPDNDEDLLAHGVLLDALRSHFFGLEAVELTQDFENARGSLSRVGPVAECFLRGAYALCLANSGRDEEAAEEAAFAASRWKAFEKRVDQEGLSSLASGDDFERYAMQRVYVVHMVRATQATVLGHANARDLIHEAVRIALLTHAPAGAVFHLLYSVVAGCNFFVDPEELLARVGLAKDIAKNAQLSLEDFALYRMSSGMVNACAANDAEASLHFLAGREALKALDSSSAATYFYDVLLLRSRMLQEGSSSELVAELAKFKEFLVQKRMRFAADAAFLLGFAFAFQGDLQKARIELEDPRLLGRSPFDNALALCLRAFVVRSSVDENPTATGRIAETAIVLADALREAGQASEMIRELVGKFVDWNVSGDAQDLVLCLRTPPVAWLSESRLFLRLFTTERRSAKQVLRVATDGSWFSLDGEERVIVTRTQPKFILEQLAHTLSDPEKRVTASSIAAALWPTEDPNSSKVRNRIHVAIAALRKSSLHELIEGDRGAYFLSPRLELRWEKP